LIEDVPTEVKEKERKRIYIKKIAVEKLKKLKE